MINIMPQTPIISMVLPKQIFDNSKKYRLFTYTVVLEYKQKILLFNTLTRELIALEKAEYENIKTDIDLYKVLIGKYFYVEENFDDKKLSNQVTSFAKTINSKHERLHFTIFPTMQCNARCFYCFEHGSKRYPMTEQTASDVADYIINKAKDKKVSIQWFGGEPLFNEKAIDIISDKLIANNIDFKTRMISNGYLFNEETALKAKIKWNLKLIQITLDGTREVYNRIKNYIYKPNDNAFDIVINNIKTALKNDIKVSIRINIDKDNCEDIKRLTKFLCNKFKGFEDKLSIYAWLLYDNRGAVKRIKSDRERNNLTDELLSIEKYIYDNGFGLKSSPSKSIKNNMCIADSDACVTILPDGSIGKCDHHSDTNLIGNIYNDILDQNVINMWKERREAVALCDKCPLYPQCIKLKHCPESGTYDCDLHEQKRLLTTLHNQMRYAYDKSLKG